MDSEVVLLPCHAVADLSTVMPADQTDPLPEPPTPSTLHTSTEFRTRAELSCEPHLLTYKIQRFVSPSFCCICDFKLMTPVTEKHV